MKKKYFKRVMGVLLSFLLFFGVLPMDAFHLHGHEETSAQPGSLYHNIPHTAH